MAADNIVALDSVLDHPDDYTDEQIAQCFIKHYEDFYQDDELADNRRVRSSCTLAFYLVRAREQKSSLRLLRILVEQAHNLCHYTSANEDTLLHHACTTENIPAIVLLLKQDRQCSCSDVTKENGFNQTPMHRVLDATEMLQGTKSVIVQLLINHAGDKLNRTFLKGNSRESLFAMIAKETNCLATFQLAVETITSLSAIDKLRGWHETHTPTMAFARHGNVDAIAYIRSLVSPEEFNALVLEQRFDYIASQNMHSINIALFSGHYALAVFFSDNMDIVPSDPNHGHHYNTSLDYAIRSKNFNVVRFAFETYPGNARSIPHEVVLNAGEYYETESFAYLIKQLGVHMLDAWSDQVGSLLHVAARTRNFPLLSYVLAHTRKHLHSCAPLKPDTPLMCAIKAYRSPIDLLPIQALLRAGANFYTGKVDAGPSLELIVFQHNSPYLMDFLMRVGMTTAEPNNITGTLAEMCCVHRMSKMLDVYIKHRKPLLSSSYSPSQVTCQKHKAYNLLIELHLIADRRQPLPLKMRTKYPGAQDEITGADEDHVAELRYKHFFSTSLAHHLITALNTREELKTYPGLLALETNKHLCA